MGSMAGAISRNKYHQAVINRLIRMKNNRYIGLCGLLWFFLLAGCQKEELLPDMPAASHRRTVLVYLGVDNNFSDEAAQKIRHLKNAWNAGMDGNLLVYADAGATPVLVHIYHSAQRGNVADTIETYAAENSAAPATLARVLNTVMEYRPAASYGLVVLSHATGWLPAAMSVPGPSPKSVIMDKGDGKDCNYMELADFAGAIPCRLDFIIFDACYMGAVEVAYELKDKADYIVASPAEVLAPGFVYSSMMQRLFCETPDLVAVARDFYEYYNDSARSGLPRSATVSVVRTAGLEALAAVARDAMRENAPPASVDGIQTFGCGARKIYFDLGDYLLKLAPSKAQDVQAALDGCIPYKASTPGYYSGETGELQPVGAFSGLTVYIPQAACPQANEAYGKLKWAERMLCE
jgi:hypothetical protein